MQNVTTVELTRDCDAVQIPSGMPMNLSKGTPVDITQTLGGVYTVRAMTGGLFRIGPKDADALGIDPSKVEARSSDTQEPANEDMVWETLRTCFDPEIPVNIVDLGLVYDMQMEKHSDGKSSVSVRMTLTAPGCGMGSIIAGDAQQKLLSLPGVEDAHVEIVWDPPWHHSMISEQGKRILGLE